MASRPHLEAFASSAGQAHGLGDYGTCTKSQFFPVPMVLHHRSQQVTRSQEWRPTGISSSFSLI